MTKKLKLAVLYLGLSPLAFAQNATKGTAAEVDDGAQDDDAAYVLALSQLGEDDEISNVIVVNSNTNVYTSDAGYRFSTARYKFRAYDSRYTDVYYNGVQVNNAEDGRFSYANIGGMNRATNFHNESNGSFEANAFSISNLGGSTNYNFRASSYARGHNITLSAANRAYTARAMYSYGTGVSKKGWSFFGTVGYRWANMKTAAVEGTFYNSFSYFLTLQKMFNDRHSLNLATWGNPAERATQAPSTDEAYWLANDRQYNPGWGYQGGKKRSARIVNSYEPTAMLTWDFKINERMKLVTSLFGKYAMYSQTSLQYNDSQKPAPDYWKNMPSNFYDVWDEDNFRNWEYAQQSWQDAYDYWTASKYNRQIHWDELYTKNLGMNEYQKDAAYYVQARHNNQIATNLGSTFEWKIDKASKLNVGLQLSNNIGKHYYTIHDLLGAEYLHNVNNYAIGNYMESSPQVQYDLRHYDPANPYSEANRVREGDRFMSDYNLLQQKGNLWATYTKEKGISHAFLSARIGGTQMWRDGKMQNGMCAEYSYGKSGKARFLDGGFKMGTSLNLGKGNAIAFGTGYEVRAPQARNAFISPEMNNNFVTDLVNEKVFTAEVGYTYANRWMKLNLNGYFTHIYDGTEWLPFYNDEENSFTYNSLTGVEKNFYGAELGAKFRVFSRGQHSLTVTALGSIAEAKYVSNTNVNYMRSIDGIMQSDVSLNKGMHEGNTPLAVASLGIRYTIAGWRINLSGNYYDRIYLTHSPYIRYTSKLEMAGLINSDGTYDIPEQGKGHGGFTLDGSIGRGFSLRHNRYLNVNLMVSNITNNTNLCTGGFEQSRSNQSTRKNGEAGSERIYDFNKNPRKYYAQGINGMLNVNLRF